MGDKWLGDPRSAPSVTPGDLPPHGALALGDAAGAAAGMYGESAYRAGSRLLDGSGSRLVCSQ